jgi:tRNA dimethylallyltransferase
MRRVIVIGGPTAAGKTDVSLALASLMRCEIICADARQLYRGLDIGTAKPPFEDRQRVGHHLFDVLDPMDHITAADYATHVRGVIEAMPDDVMPVVVGGSGLYICAAIDGFSPAVTDVSEDIRSELRIELETRGRDQLYQELEMVDPIAAQLYKDRNPRRVLRALEVYRSSGRPISELWNVKPVASGYDVLHIAIGSERQDLRRRIQRRSQQMWSMGLLGEVENLLSSGVSRDAQSMQSVGYREAADVLSGTISIDTAKERLETATWRYAKRQLTWFRRDLRYTWLESDPTTNALAIRSLMIERKWIDE